MANELLEKPIEYEVNGEQVKLSGNMVKQFLVSGQGNVSDQEVVMFLQLCRYQHLNPFLNEAYLVKFGSNPAQIIVSKDAFMKRAENNKHYRGFKAGVVVARDEDIKYLPGAIKLPKDVLIGGWAEVKRDDRDEPVRTEISMNEFSKSQATWKSMPMNMIRKTAIVNCLREAFPETLGAMYTEDDKPPVNQQPKPVAVDETPASETTSDLLKGFKKAQESKTKTAVEPDNKAIKELKESEVKENDDVPEKQEKEASTEAEQEELLHE